MTVVTPVKQKKNSTVNSKPIKGKEKDAGKKERVRFSIHYFLLMIEL